MTNYCQCGCGSVVASNRKYVSGHNLLGLKKTDEHRAKIGQGQRRAWRTKRQRLPVGSTRKDVYGYTVVKVHPGKGRWVGEHVLTMEQIIGRKLRRGEEVHHINKRRDDNRPENLFLCENKQQHNQVERSLISVISRLVDQGVIIFNHETGQYESVL